MAAPAMTMGTGYWAWLAAAICSEFGSTVMAFAIIWTATRFGGTIAGLVTSSTMLFRTVCCSLAVPWVTGTGHAG